MVPSLKVQMLDASQPKEAMIQLVKQAVVTILKLESERFRTDEDDLALVEAGNQLMDGARQLRASEIAPIIQDFADETRNDTLRGEVLGTIEKGLQSGNVTINDRVVDTLALSSIYESSDLKKSRSVSADAYFYLGKGQQDKLPQIIDTLKHLQSYYPQNVKGDDDFKVSILQMQDLDAIIIAKAKEYLDAPEKDPEIAEELVSLLIDTEDADISVELTRKLFDHRTEAGKVGYVKDLVEDAALCEDDDTEVGNPILARFGKTYGEVIAAVGKQGGSVEQLLGYGTAVQQSFEIK